MPGQKTIENEDKAAMGSYRPESNFGTSDTVRRPKKVASGSLKSSLASHAELRLRIKPVYIKEF